MKRKIFEILPNESEEPISEKLKQTPKSISLLNADEKHSIFQYLSKEDVISSMMGIPLSKYVVYEGKTSFYNYLFVLLGDKDKWEPSDIIKWLSYETVIFNGSLHILPKVLKDIGYTIGLIESEYNDENKNVYPKLVSKHHHVQFYQIKDVKELRLSGIRTASGIIYPWTFEYFGVEFMNNWKRLFNEYETFHFRGTIGSWVVDALWDNLQSRIKSHLPFPQKNIKHTFDVWFNDKAVFGGDPSKYQMYVEKILNIVNTGFVELEDILFIPNNETIPHFYPFLQNLSFAKRLYIRIDMDESDENYDFLLPIIQLWYQKFQSPVYFTLHHSSYEFNKTNTKAIFLLLNEMTIQNIPFFYYLPFCDLVDALDFIKFILNYYPKNFEMECQIPPSEYNKTGNQLKEFFDARLERIKNFFPHYDIYRDAKQFWIYKVNVKK